ELEVDGANLPWPEGERRRLRIRLRNTGYARWLAGERGPGGMSVVVKLLIDGGEDRLWGTDLFDGGHWLPLPRDLAPGEELVLETDVRRPPGPGRPRRRTPPVRRPPGPARLWIEPPLFGGLSLSNLGGPDWDRWI